jgi:hypothetical protein
LCRALAITASQATGSEQENSLPIRSPNIYLSVILCPWCILTAIMKRNKPRFRRLMTKEAVLGILFSHNRVPGWTESGWVGVGAGLYHRFLLFFMTPLLVDVPHYQHQFERAEVKVKPEPGRPTECGPASANVDYVPVFLSPQFFLYGLPFIWFFHKRSK